MRACWRRTFLGLSTILRLAPRGFFIPHRYAAAAKRVDYPALRPLFEAAEPRFVEIVETIETYREDLLRIAAGQGPARFDQDWFPRLDAAAAYAIVRDRRPRRIVEIGSGHSTRFLAQAVADGAMATSIICIDPAPRAGLDRLGVRHEKRLLGPADGALAAELEAGDLLFVDSSHIAMPGTDVAQLFLDIVPRLRSGVLVHVHDVFLPDPYPSDWAWRGYNEQLLVGALLQGGAYEILFPSRYATARRAELLRGSVIGRLGLLPGAYESSLWLKKR